MNSRFLITPMPPSIDVPKGSLIRKMRLSALATAILLSGCFAQLIRDDASSKIKDGNYEAALTGLRDGVQKYPDSIVLKSGLISAKEEIATRLIAESNQQRSQGNFEAADKALQRGTALDIKREQFTSLQSDLLVEKRLFNKVVDAQKLLDAGHREDAVKLVDAGLREAPRQTALLALKRRIESEFRGETEANNRTITVEDKRISLDFRSAPMMVVLEAVTRSSGVNFILDRDVKQDTRVTINLRSAKVNEAIDLVLGANQLSKRVIDAQTLLIYPNTPEKLREHQEQVIKVFYLANADVKATAALLKSMLKVKEAFVDERTNMIVLRESPDIIALAERLVSLHDVAEAEIMLEVEILEIKTSRLTELGLNFPTTATINPAAKTGLLGLTGRYFQDWRNGLIEVGVGGLLANFRREVGDFNTLANPRIRAKSREKAKILIGDKVPVVTTTTSTSGAVSENISYLDVGIKLDVESAASPDDEVLIKLGLEVSTLAKEVRTTSGALAYQIGTRNANTVLRLRDGETQLLGGLISNEDRSSSNRVPGLGDLPVLGRLFSSQKDDLQRTELILAITPRILRNTPRPDIAQTELWVGTEQATKLKLSPARESKQQASNTSAVKKPIDIDASAQTSEKVNLANTNTGNTNAPVENTNTSPKILQQPFVRVTWNGSKESKLGDVFTVSLLVSSNADLLGLPMEIGFPTEKVELLSISEGNYFKKQGDANSFIHSVNVATGRIGVGILRNDSTGISGEGEVVKLQFKAKSAGTLEFILTSLKPMSTVGEIVIQDLPKFKTEIK
jgi:general secretion pathway protein D